MSSTRIGDIDLHLVGEGRHERIYEKLGAHVTDEGVAFAVWAPNATKVSVVGEWNGWDGRANPMEQRGVSGIWETVVPDAPEGALYRFEIAARDGSLLLKSDPYATAAEKPPRQRLAHLPRASRVERRRVGRASARCRAVRRPDVGLRGASRLVAPHARTTRRSTIASSRAQLGDLREGPRASRTSSCCR